MKSNIWMLFVVSLVLLSQVSASQHHDMIQEIEYSKESMLKDLYDFVSIPSVSSDKGHRGDVRRAIEFVKRKLDEIGFSNTQILETYVEGNASSFDQHPSAFGEYIYNNPKDHAKPVPVLLIYGHADVQPAEPEDGQWKSHPFKTEVRDGAIYGRGSADDKGPIIAMIHAFKTIIQLKPKLSSFHVKVLIEGQEEIGSPHMNEFVKRHKDLLACDHILSVDGGPMPDDETPGILIGLKGSVAMAVDVFGPSSDLHSGVYGGMVMNPALVLSSVLSSLVDLKTGKIMVPGIYDQVVDLTPLERESFKSYPVPEKVELDAFNVSQPFGEHDYTVRERQFARPTLDVIGMKSGYIGDGFKGIIPASSHAKINLRLVPDMVPEEALDLLCSFIQSKQADFPGVRIEVTKLTFQAKPFGVRNIEQSKITKSLEYALKDLYGADKTIPLHKMGGSIPIVSYMDDHLANPDLAFLSLVSPSSMIHAPNENMKVLNLMNTAKAVVIVIEELFKLPEEPRKKPIKKQTREEL